MSPTPHFPEWHFPEKDPGGKSSLPEYEVALW